MRITINLNEETLKRVDEEAKKLGTSRGAMLTTWVGEKLNNLETSRNIIATMFQNKELVEQASKFVEQNLKKGGQ